MHRRIMPKPNFALIECECPADTSCRKISFGPDGRSILGFIIENGKHWGAMRWDAETGKVLEAINQFCNDDVTGILASSDHQQLAISFGMTIFGKRIEIVSADDLKRFAEIKVDHRTLAWSPDQAILATVGNAGELKCWDIVGTSEIALLKLKEAKECDDIRCVGFLAGGKEIVIGRNSGILVWDFKNGRTEQHMRFKSKDGYFWQHGLSPDGSVFLSLSDRGVLLHTDLRKWQTKRFEAVKNSHGCNFSFSPDGKLAATETGDGTVFVWDIQQGCAWLKWKRPNYGNLQSIIFSPDSQRLACILDFQPFILDFHDGAKPVAIAKQKLPTGMLQCIGMVGSDERMDLQGGGGAAFNPLPVKCSYCRMPDLDFIAKPYLLSRGIDSPAEIAPAENGNFLVRDSAKRMLEIVASGQCKFYPTTHVKTKQATPWFLAVPQHLETTATPPQGRERCPQCNEPWCFHDYSEASDKSALESPIAAHELFKARHWVSHKVPFKSWKEPRPDIFGRRLYFSIRLATLFKKLKMRGLVQSYDCKEMPSAEDLTWAEEKLRVINQSPSSVSKKAKPSDLADWFANYLQKNAKKKPVAHDCASIEKKSKLKLPDSYKKFIATVGTKTFKNVDGEEGFTTHILPPKKLDYEEFRKLATDAAEDEERIDGVVFASTDHGDVFCFDVGTKTHDYPVYKYDHETDGFEPYTQSFAQCIRRFHGA